MVSGSNLVALTIWMEFSVIPGRIQMERFIPVESFRKKVMLFQVFSFSRFYQNSQKFLYHLSTLHCQLSFDQLETVKMCCLCIIPFNFVLSLAWLSFCCRCFSFFPVWAGVPRRGYLIPFIALPQWTGYFGVASLWAFSPLHVMLNDLRSFISTKKKLFSSVFP